MKQPLAVGFVVGAALKLEFLWVMKELSYRCGAPPCTEHVLTLRVIPSCQDHQAAIPSCQDHHAGPDEISYQRPWSKTHIPPFGGNQFGKDRTHKVNETTSSTFWPQCQENPYPKPAPPGPWAPWTCPQEGRPRPSFTGQSTPTKQAAWPHFAWRNKPVCNACFVCNVCNVPKPPRVTHGCIRNGVCRCYSVCVYIYKQV